MDTGKEKLKIDWCEHDAVVFACKNWHYSHSVPAGKLVKIGVWESGIFKGVVVFSRGANKSIASPYSLNQSEVCELTRVALTKHYAPVTQIVSIAIKMLRKLCPDLRLIVSYADIDRGHEGIIYKAGNWIYEGMKTGSHLNSFILFGKKTHKRTLAGKYGAGSQKLSFLKTLDPKASEFESKGKHKYLYILDNTIRPAILKVVSSYAKR